MAQAETPKGELLDVLLSTPNMTLEPKILVKKDIYGYTLQIPKNPAENYELRVSVYQGDAEHK